MNHSPTGSSNNPSLHHRSSNKLSQNSMYSGGSPSPSQKAVTFETKYQNFQLNSKLNEIAMLLEKKEIELQEKKEYSRQLEADKVSLAQEHQLIVTEYEKFRTIAEAEKKAKKIVAKQFQSLQEEGQKVRMVMGLKAEEESDKVVEKMQMLVSQKAQYFKTIEALSEQLERSQRQWMDREKKNQQAQRGEFDKVIKAKEKIIDDKDRQISKISHQLKLRIEETQILQQRIRKYESFEQLSLQKANQVEQMTAKLKNQDKELTQLKAKQDIWGICRQKMQQERLKHAQEVENMKYQLLLKETKIKDKQGQAVTEMHKAKQAKLKIEQMKTQIDLCRQKELQLRDEAQKYRALWDRSSMYQGKYQQQKSEVNIKQEEVDQMRKVAEKYVAEVETLREQNSCLTTNLQNLTSQYHSIEKELEMNYQERQSLSSKLSQLQQKIRLIKQQSSTLRVDKEKIMTELTQIKAKRSKLNKSISGQSSLQKVNWQQLQEQTAAHYGQLLQIQEQSRKRLMQQIMELEVRLSQEKQASSGVIKELRELKQEHIILKDQYSHLQIRFKSHQKAYEHKIQSLTKHYQQLLKANNEVIVHPVSTLKPRAQSHYFQGNKNNTIISTRPQSEPIAAQPQNLVKSRSFEQILKDYRSSQASNRDNF